MLGTDHFKYSSKVTRFEHWANEQLQKGETEHVNGLFFSFTLSNQSTPSNLLTVTNCLPQAHLWNSSWTKKNKQNQNTTPVNTSNTWLWGKISPNAERKESTIQNQNKRFSFDHKAFAEVPPLPFEALNLKEENKMLRVTQTPSQELSGSAVGHSSSFPHLFLFFLLMVVWMTRPMQLQHIDIHSVHPQSSRCSRVAMETCRWICTLVVVAFFNGFMIQCLFCVLCAGSVWSS